MVETVVALRERERERDRPCLDRSASGVPPISNFFLRSMWSFASNAIAAIGRRKKSRDPIIAVASDTSSDDDDDNRSNASQGGDDDDDENDDDGLLLECPICCESFNIVENVPYVLWCGHTLCGNCLLALQPAVLPFPAKKIAFPFFISCPWCHLFSFRLVCNGNLSFPRKNFFLLWMIERLNGDRAKMGPSSSSSCTDNQPICSAKNSLTAGDRDGNWVVTRRNRVDFVDYDDDNGNSSRSRERQQQRFICLHNSMEFFIHFTSKFPFVILFLVVLFLAIPVSAIILVLYLVVSVMFAVPSVFVLYFACPTLARLVREIIS